MNETRQMLDEYIKEGSESAFRELVSRYIDLVYSVALRRVSGDTHRAEDITQKVFSDLARKAHSLPREIMLGGWLHRHCCFIASSSNRSEFRRHAREREAMQIDALNPAPDSDWAEVAPALDSAIQELPESDRDAIILRFFESQDLKKVGTVLGVSEDAAQKRVSRALEKLRGMLLSRGVSLSIAALTTALLTHAITAAPLSLGPKIVTTSLKTAAATTGIMASIIALLSSTAAKVALLAAATVLTFVAVSKSPLTSNSSKTESTAIQHKSSPATPVETTSASTRLNTPETSEVKPASTVAGLRLQLLNADNSTVANGLIEERMWQGKKFSSKNFTSDENGTCEIPLPDGITELNLTTRIDPFADTRLLWHPDRGDKIPADYTLHLVHGIPIGGQVVDSENHPVRDAKVGFNHEENPASESTAESHNFAWIETKTDLDGKWRINRIAEEVLRRIYGGASHPDYVSSEMVFVTQQSTALNQLKALKLKFELGKALMIKGYVLDESGNPVPDSKVLAGTEGNGDARTTQAALDGSFELKGCKPGKILLTASSPRYAPTTIQIEAKQNSEPINITLKPGKILKLLVVNKIGEPIPNAQLWLNTMHSGRIVQNETNAPLIQTEYSPKTDANGRVLWDQAPDRELAFDAEATGYMRVFEWKVRPDGEEHIITLGSALKIEGTVLDARNQAPIPRFKIITGWPESLANPVPRWSSLERFWLTFNNGKFQHEFGEPVIIGTTDPAFLFKFEADGYAPFISRVIKADEGTVTLDVRLTPAQSQTITVLLPEGTPAAHADVAFGNESEIIEVAENGFSRLSTPLKSTDQNGKLEWQSDPNLQNIAFYHPNGFAVRTSADLSKNSKVQLQGWARIEGKLTSRGKPVSGRQLSLDFDRNPASPMKFIFQERRTKTDASGNFTMEKLAPGKLRIMEQLAGPNPRPGQAQILTFLGTVEAKPNETTVFNHDENGSIVSLKIIWPENTPRAEDAQVFVAVATPFTPPPLGLRNNPEALKRWRELPEVEEMISKMESWPLFENAPGVWKSLALIPPGRYEMRVMVTSKAAQAGAPMLHAESTVVIPENGSENLELGPIALNSSLKLAE